MAHNSQRITAKPKKLHKYNVDRIYNDIIKSVGLKFVPHLRKQHIKMLHRIIHDVRLAQYTVPSDQYNIKSNRRHNDSHLCALQTKPDFLQMTLLKVTDKGAVLQEVTINTNNCKISDGIEWVNEQQYCGDRTITVTYLVSTSGEKSHNMIKTKELVVRDDDSIVKTEVVSIPYSSVMGRNGHKVKFVTYTYIWTTGNLQTTLTFRLPTLVKHSLSAQPKDSEPVQVAHELESSAVPHKEKHAKQAKQVSPVDTDTPQSERAAIIHKIRREEEKLATPPTREVPAEDLLVDEYLQEEIQNGSFTDRSNPYTDTSPLTTSEYNVMVHEMMRKRGDMAYDDDTKYARQLERKTEVFDSEYDFVDTLQMRKKAIEDEMKRQSKDVKSRVIREVRDSEHRDESEPPHKPASDEDIVPITALSKLRPDEQMKIMAQWYKEAEHRVREYHPSVTGEEATKMIGEIADGIAAAWVKAREKRE